MIAIFETLRRVPTQRTLPAALSTNLSFAYYTDPFRALSPESAESGKEVAEVCS
jgi:hypothetical protein